MQKFVIAGIQRSGTTLVRTTIDSHPDIECLGEVFFMGTKAVTNKGTNVSRGFSVATNVGYKSFVAQSLGRRFRSIVAQSGIVNEYLDALYQAPGHSAIGFKFMFGQLKKYPAVLPYLINNDIKVINVIRENFFRIHLSHLTMQARGVAHSTSKTSKVTVKVPIAGLINRLNSLKSDGLRWQETFSGNPNYLAITYEAFVEDKDVNVKKILSFLDMDPDISLQSDLVRLNTAPLSEIVENLDEVVDCLANTSFSQLIV